jgi:hypothetical protein
MWSSRIVQSALSNAQTTSGTFRSLAATVKRSTIAHVAWLVLLAVLIEIEIEIGIEIGIGIEIAPLIPADPLTLSNHSLEPGIPDP